MLLSSYIEQFKNVRALCIGDIMLDRFVYGVVERISPEAPVPVFNVRSEKSMLGGAGNVVANLATLGCQTFFSGIIGTDEAGCRLERFLKNAGVTPLLVKEQTFPTILKTRIIAGNNHLLRADQEVKLVLTSDMLAHLKQKIETILPDIDVVLLSDYNKGIFTPESTQMFIQICRFAGKPVIIDPKGNDYSKYAGATLIKPNLKEFEQATGLKLNPNEGCLLETIKKGARWLFETYHIENLLVTLSEHGMAYVSSETPDEILQIPTEAKEVFDVSGAGDTSLATLGAAMGARVPIKEAMKLANMASGIVVGKLGTACVSSDELRDALSKRSAPGEMVWEQKRKIISPAEALQKAQQARQTHQKIGFIRGCFDLLHLGHLHALMQAKKACDVLIVGLNSDASVKRIKGEDRPIQEEKTRAFLLASLSFVDYVVVLDEETPSPLVQKIKPDVIAKEEKALNQGTEEEFVLSYGGKTLSLSKLEGYSTTSLISNIRRNHAKTN